MPLDGRLKVRKLNIHGVKGAANINKGGNKVLSIIERLINVTNKIGKAVCGAPTTSECVQIIGKN